MKIEITFDEEDNEFALVKLDGGEIKITPRTRSAVKENTPAYFIADILSDSVRKIIEIRGLQEGYWKTWDEISDEITLECMEDAAI